MEVFGIFEDDEPLVTIDASNWTGLKSAMEDIKKATGKSAGNKAKGGVQKLLSKQLEKLCSEGMLLVITNTKNSKSDVVCQLLQIMEGVFEELEEDMGKVLCVLPGWDEDEVSGPSIDDPEELVSIPVMPADEFGMPAGMGNMTEEEMKAAMAKAGYVFDSETLDSMESKDEDGEDVDVDTILGKINSMKLSEESHDEQKKQRKKDKKKKKKEEAESLAMSQAESGGLSSGVVVEELD